MPTHPRHHTRRSRRDVGSHGVRLERQPADAHFRDLESNGRSEGSQDNGDDRRRSGARRRLVEGINASLIPAPRPTPGSAPRDHRPATMGSGSSTVTKAHPKDREWTPDHFVFGNEIGERVLDIKTAWQGRLRPGRDPRFTFSRSAARSRQPQARIGLAPPRRLALARALEAHDDRHLSERDDTAPASS